MFTPDDASAVTKLEVFHFDSPGMGLAMYNTVQSVKDFAHSSFKLAIEKEMPLVSSNSEIPTSRAGPDECLVCSISRPRTPSSKGMMDSGRTFVSPYSRQGSERDRFADTGASRF